MANPQAAAAATPTPSVAPSEEQRVAEQRLKDLEAQASASATEAQQAKADKAAAEGDLERAKAEIVALRSNLERVTAENRALLESTAARDQLPSLPVDLPKGAYQLTDSVTIATLGKSPRAAARRGDVVFQVGKAADAEEDAAELQRGVGQVARVHAVSKETLDELRGLKLIR